MSERFDSEACDEVVGREPCPSCRESGGDNSGDNLAVYADDHKHCFACGHHENGSSGGTGASRGTGKPTEFDRLDFDTSRGLKARGISAATCAKFGYGLGVDFNDQKIHVCDVRDENGTLVAQKCRTRSKDFWTNGSLKTKPLIGMHLWSGGKKLVITEGEIDMLTYAELTNCKYAVVSLPNGVQSAKKVLLAKRKYLSKFDEVILMFDMDEPGREAATECMMVDPNRIKVASLPLKDANECMMNGEGKAVLDAVWNAESWKPSQIVTVDDIFEQALIKPQMGLSLPWPTATEKTLGLRRGEIHIIGAAPKIGKTEHQHQMIYHMTKVHNERIGVMSLEEHPVKTLKKVAGKLTNNQFTKPQVVAGWTDEELRAGLEECRNKIEFYSSEGVRDYEEILDTIRYWANSGIWFFIIDPLTALVAEHDSSSANDILNEFMSKAASLCMEMKITMFMYSHVNPVKTGLPHDKGGDVLSSQFTGSRAMEKWAHYGWGIMRDRTSEDEIVRNTARVKMLFDREFGEYCEYHCFYDSEKNDWSECSDTSDDPPFSNEEDEEF